MKKHIFPALMFLWGVLFGGALVALVMIYG